MCQEKTRNYHTMRHYKLYLCLKLLELMRTGVAPENISTEWCDVEWFKYKELIKAGILYYQSFTLYTTIAAMHLVHCGLMN
jgi:hypothetical protein